MAITLPKRLDDTILLIDSACKNSGRPAFKWSTTRKFIEQAATAAVRSGIFVPPLFTLAVGEQSTSNAITSNAIGWSTGVLRQIGQEVKIFDSLYMACRWAEQEHQLSAGEAERQAIMFHVNQAVNIARFTTFNDTDSWDRGMVKDVDYCIAASILARRFNASIVDVMKQMGASSSLDFPRAYAVLTKLNQWEPSDFVNEAIRALALVDIAGDVNESRRRSGLSDEYRAVIEIVSEGHAHEGREFLPAEFESRFLNIDFSNDDQRDTDERRVTHA